MTFSLSNKSFRNIILAVILVIGIVLSILVSALSYRAEENLKWHEFNADVENRNSALEREIELDVLLLKSLQALNSIKNKDITRQEFRNFTSHILKQYEDVQALEWIPRVPDSRREEYESSARKRRPDGFSVHRTYCPGKDEESGEAKGIFSRLFCRAL